MEIHELFYEDEKFELFVKNFKEFTTGLNRDENKAETSGARHGNDNDDVDYDGHCNDEDDVGHANNGDVHANEKKEQAEMQAAAEANEVVFDDGKGTIAHRKEMQSLAPGIEIEKQIIDTLVTVLNYEGRIRTDEKDLRRRYFPTDAVLLNEDNDQEKKYKSFQNVIKNQRNASELKKKMKDVELAFFPTVVAVGQYYVIVFNLLKTNAVILDNEKHNDYNKYKEVFDSVKVLFLKYLKKHQHPCVENLSKDKPAKVLKMKWKTKKNKIDSGLYMMMHMELYQGESATNWKTDIADYQQTTKNEDKGKEEVVDVEQESEMNEGLKKQKQQKPKKKKNQEQRKREECPMGDIVITPKTVKKVLGLPMGRRKLEREGQREYNDPFLEEWKDKFKNINKLIIKALSDLIIDTKNTDYMFRMNILTLIPNTLGSCENNSSLKFTVLRNVFEGDDVSDIDWCSYILECASVSKVDTSKKEKKDVVYYGPVMFLMEFYELIEESILIDKSEIEEKINENLIKFQNDERLIQLRDKMKVIFKEPNIHEYLSSSSTESDDDDDDNS
nr:peptidase C48, SUMO/sentrin/Ubl1 [Tanacetum cinerariifolium]